MINLYKLLYEEATPDDPFGKILFGDERKLPEENTEEEDELARGLKNHYYGDMHLLSPWLKQLVDLEHKGKYKDVLEVPKEYKYAYRLTGKVPKEVVEGLVGHGIDTDKLPLTDWVVENGAFYTPRGKEHASWTLEPEVFYEILKDWGNIANGKLGYYLLLRAPINSNTFLLNPEETDALAGEYAYQKEVISVGTVNCDQVMYFDLSNMDRLSKVKQALIDEKKLIRASSLADIEYYLISRAEHYIQF